MSTDTQIVEFDRAGVTLLCTAIVGVPIVLLALPWYFFPIAFFCFVICNFGGHAAIHRSLFPCTTPSRKLLNEFLLFGAYFCHFMNYQLIVPAHVLHHSWGRTDALGSADIVQSKRNPFAWLRYYSMLLILPAFSWLFISIWKLFTSPFAREQANRGGKKFRYYLPYGVPQLAISAFLVLSAIKNPIGVFLYFFVSAVFWNMMQNVAHYGLKGFDTRSHSLAARTYIVGPIVKRLTYGALTHLPHHVFMDAPGHSLDQPEMIRKVEAHVGSRIRVTYGFGPYLRDVFVQLRGPVLEKDLTMEWLAGKVK